MESKQPSNDLTKQPTNRRASQSSRIVMLVLAASMLLCGLCACALYIIVPLSERATSQLETNTVLGAAASFGIFFGAILGWMGLKKDSPAAARYFPPVLAFVLAFLGAILLGTSMLAVKSIAPYTFPPFHFLAGMLIALGFIAYAARRLGTLSELRTLIGSFTWGAVGATFLALIGELVAAAVILLVVLIVLSLDPNGKTALEQFAAQVRLARGANAEHLAEQLLANPWVGTGLVIYFALIVPPTEEAVKTLSLAFLNPQRTRLADAVLWGMAAGAGFSALENLFNGAAMLNLWAFGMLMRVGATVMHVANGALLGRGWYAARVEGKWSRLLLTYAVAVIAHGLWNGAVIVLSQRAASLGSDPPALVSQLATQGILIFSLTAIIAILCILGFVWIAYAVNNARQNSSHEGVQ